MSSPITDQERRHLLDRAFVHGIAWTTAGKWITQLFNWAATLVIARMLSPEDYGIVGMAMVYIGFTAIVTEFGMSSAVVALRNLTSDQLAQMNSVAVGLGLAGAAVSLIVAFPLAWFFRSPSVAPVVMALSLTLLIDSFRSVPAAAVAKKMQFKYLALIDGLKAIVVSSATLVLVFAGFGYWALVVGNLVSSALPTLLMAFRHPIGFQRPRKHQLTEAIDYTKHMMAGTLAWYAYSNADFVVAGRVLGRASLGDYTLAWTLASSPIERVAAIINRVVPPLYAAVNTDKAALRRYLLRISQALSLFVFPAAVGLSLVARDFITTLLGPKWIGAVVPLRILAFYALLQTMAVVAHPILIATGRVRTAARIGTASAIVLPAGFIVGGITYGTFGIAVVWITLYPVVLWFMYRVAFEIIDLNFGAYFRVLAPAALSTLCMAVCVIGMGAAEPDVSPLLMLTAKVATGVAVYAAVLYSGWKKHLADMIGSLKALR